MKKVIMILMLLLGVVMAEAMEPYGDYVCRYIVEKGRYQKIYNPIKITHYGIQVKNTNAGTKIWQAIYQGPIRLTNRGGSERFHNFYLTNQRVEFSISDRPCASHNGKKYYIINFDGQWQLAEAL